MSLGVANTALANDPGSCGLPALATGNKTINILVNFLTSMPTYTLGVTSGASKCSGIAQLEQERLYFVATNYDDLTEEAAQGRGQHLETLAMLMGCQAQETQFASLTKDRFDRLFQTEVSAAQICTAG